MGAWALWFWLALVLFFEVVSARYAAYVLGLALSLILTCAAFLFACEFDLLAAMVLVTYGSVFILLGLLLMQFASLRGPAERGGLGPRPALWLGIFWGMVWVLCAPAYMAHSRAWSLSILWQDILGLGGEEFYQAGMIAHELLYRFFIFETIWANVFLVVAFVVYALLLKIRAVLNLGGGLGTNSRLLGVELWRMRWVSYSARAIHHPRRQSRRLSVSTVRHRL